MPQKGPWCRVEDRGARPNLSSSLASPETVGGQLGTDENLNVGKSVGRLVVVGDEDGVDSRYKLGRLSDLLNWQMVGGEREDGVRMTPTFLAGITE